MANKSLWCGRALLLAPFLAVPVCASADPVLQKQAPCNQGSIDFCVSIAAGSQPSFNVRSITFDAPTSGTALLLFQGTMYCAHYSNSREAVDIDTQLVESSVGLAGRDQPGGARYFFKLQGGNTSATVNVNAVRAFPVPSAGSHQYYFTGHISLLDAGVTCSFYNVTHSIMFVPG